MSVFGPIVTGADVEAAMTDTVMLWARDYLAEVGYLSGRSRAALPTFRSFSASFDTDRFDDGQLPACIVVAPGTAEEPEVDGAGAYRVAWSVAVAAVVKGPDQATTFDLVRLYAAALRALVAQRPSLGGFAAGVRWTGERYDELDTDDSRTIAAAIVFFTVDVDDVLDATAGPAVPSLDPTIPPPNVGTVRIVDTDLEVSS